MSREDSICISFLKREAEHFFHVIQSYLYFLSVNSAHSFSYFSIRLLVFLFY